MSERVKDKTDRIELVRLKKDDILRITSGTPELTTFYYDFAVEVQGKWPVGVIQEFTREGVMVIEGRFELQGSGIWTTQAQNPVQKQPGIAFTSEFQDLFIGGFMVGCDPDNRTDRIVFNDGITRLEFIQQ